MQGKTQLKVYASIAQFNIVCNAKMLLLVKYAKLDIIKQLIIYAAIYKIAKHVHLRKIQISNNQNVSNAKQDFIQLTEYVKTIALLDITFKKQLRSLFFILKFYNKKI